MKDLIDIYFEEFIDEENGYLMLIYVYVFGDCIKEWMKGLIKEQMGKVIFFLYIIVLYIIMSMFFG